MQMRTRWLTGWSNSIRSTVGLIGVMAFVIAAVHAESPADAAAKTSMERARLNSYMKLPLRFEANKGQTDQRVQFLSRGAGYSLYLLPGEAVVALQSPTGEKATLEMTMAGADSLALATGLEPSASHSNYFIGNSPAAWRTDVPEFGRVHYAAIYPGVDLTFYGNQRRLEYDFVVAPGADPNAIRLNFRGMRHMHLDPRGDLLLTTAAGEVRLDQPVMYQQNADGSRTVVQGSFVVARHEVRFKLGAYDKSRPLVIDPVINYTTYLGGSGNENYFSDSKTISYLSGIVVGSDGSAYVYGVTSSIDFPLAGAAQASFGGGTDVFVTKFNPTGTAIDYSTYLGGSDQEYGGGIAVDANGNAYVAGSTFSSNYPVTAGALQSAATGTGCGFVTKLSSSGSALVYSTYLGGSYTSRLTAIAVDSNLNAYVTGTDNKNFPTTPSAFQQTVPGLENTVVAKLAVDGKSLVYSTYLGGENVDVGRGIAVDSSFNAYITGFTNSVSFPVVPTTGALQSTNGGGDDAFVSKLNPTGSALIYSTYLGGSSDDVSTSIAIDTAGNAYITGYTDSSNFPTASPQQSTYGGGQDGFVSKLAPDGTSLVYSTYLGSKGAESGLGIAIDSLGDAYVTGYTGSIGGSSVFPTLNSLPFVDNNQFTASFVTEYNPTGSAFIYSTYFGGNTGGTSSNAIAIDSGGNVYITGGTYATDLPITAGAYQQALNGPTDAFVAKLWPLALTPTTLAFPNTTVDTTSAPLTATLANSGFATLDISGLAIATGDTADFAETTTCGATLAAQSSCTISVTFTPSSVKSFASAVDVTDSAAIPPQVVTLTGNGIAAAAPKAVLNPTSVPFGNQAVTTTSSTQVVALSNPGTATLNISNIALTGANPTAFAINSACGATLAAGASCNISVNFSPSSTGPYSAAISVTDNAAGSPQSTTLTGTGTAAPAPTAVLSPATLSFASLVDGTSSPAQTVTLSNTGNATLNITTITLLTGNTTAFSLTNGCGATLAAGSSCTMNVSFTPNAVGALSTSLSVTDNAPNSPQSVAISGTGTAAPAAQAVLTPSTVAFGNQVTGTTSAAKALTLSNPGNAALSITGITLTGSNPSDFALTNTCGMTLAAGATCSISVTFSPSSVASFSATVSVTDSVSGSPQTSALTGAGVVPPDFTVASTTPPQTIREGASATYQINVASADGNFTLPVTLSATGLPLGASVTFTPATVTPGVSGGTSSMVIQTEERTGALRRKAPLGPAGPKDPMEIASAAAMVCLLVLRRKSRLGRGSRLLVIAGGLLLLSLGVSACGGGFPAPSTTYTITVTGSNGSDQHATTVTLTVQ